MAVVRRYGYPHERAARGVQLLKLTVRHRDCGLWAATTCAALASFAYLRLAAIPADASSSLCFSRQFLHFSCPGCGLTRAFAALARGDFLLSLQFHPLGPLFVLEGVIVWAGWGLILLGTLRAPATRSIDTFLFVQLFLLVAVWLARLVTGTLPG